MNQSQTPFQLDFGTKPTTVKLEEIQVSINSEVMIGDYAVAYMKELKRRNPGRFEEVGLTETELKDYFDGLIQLRVEMISRSCPKWRQAKMLLIPSFIQFVLSQVGTVVLRDRGMKIIPELAISYDIARLLDTSSKLSAFLADGVVLHKDAFPRSEDGDEDVMTMAIIEDYVVGQTAIKAPMASYVAAFLGMKLQQEANLKMLYRVRYDDLSFIREMLMHEQKVFL